MSLKYRIKYHKSEDDRNNITVKPGHVSNLIIVRMMDGKEYIFGTQNDDETYLDIKLALLDILTPMPLLRQLVFTDLDDFIDRDSDKGYKAIPDNKKLKKILPGDVKINQPIKIELLIIEPTWNDSQKPFIDMTNMERVVIRTLYIDTPDKMEAVRWGLQHNSSILSLQIIRAGEMNEFMFLIITDLLLRDNASIQRLELDGHGKINVHDTSRLLDIIRQNNTLISIKIVSGSYRLNDLSTLLSQNTSLRSINLSVSNIEAGDDDIMRFGEVLASQKTLKSLIIKFSKIVDDGNGLLTGKLRDILLPVGTPYFGEKNEINVQWTNPNAI
jgi:hypothetical protein